MSLEIVHEAGPRGRAWGVSVEGSWKALTGRCVFGSTWTQAAAWIHFYLYVARMSPPYQA